MIWKTMKPTSSSDNTKPVFSFTNSLTYKAISNSYVKFSEIEKKHKEAFFQKLKDDYIQKQAEWKNDDVFKDLSKDLILIFDAAIISKNHREFEYRVNMKRLQLSKKENFLLNIKNLTNINIL